MCLAYTVSSICVCVLMVSAAGGWKVDSHRIWDPARLQLLSSLGPQKPRPVPLTPFFMCSTPAAACGRGANRPGVWDQARDLYPGLSSTRQPGGRCCGRERHPPDTVSGAAHQVGAAAAVVGAAAEPVPGQRWALLRKGHCK